jgi:hypothetical protein
LTKSRSTVENAVRWLFLDLSAFSASCEKREACPAWQAQSSLLLFPLGNLGQDETGALAWSFGRAVADMKDSQDTASCRRGPMRA